MSSSLPFSERVMIAFFILLMLIGGAAMGWTISSIPADFWHDIATFSQISSGAATRKFSKKINQDFVFSQPLHQTERVVSWLLTGDWGPGVREGCDGWLFLRDELMRYPDAQAAASMRLRAGIVQQLAHTLAAQKIQLMVVLVPDKSRIESAHLCGLHRSDSFAGRAQEWIHLTGLPVLGTELGVELHAVDDEQGSAIQGGIIQGSTIVDLTPLLKQQSGARFYRTDSHWNEAAAAQSAQAIARYLHGLHWIASINNTTGVTDIRDVSLEVHSVMKLRPGDLFHLATLDQLPAWLGPKPELTMQSIWNGGASPSTAGADDLFGDVDLPKIVLVGTSFSLRSNFFNALQHAVGVPLANVAKDGGEFDGAMRDYLSSATFKQTPPHVIIWEIPERMLQAPSKPVEQQWSDHLKLQM